MEPQNSFPTLLVAGTKYTELGGEQGRAGGNHMGDCLQSWHLEQIHMQLVTSLISEGKLCNLPFLEGSFLSIPSLIIIPVLTVQGTQWV